MKANEILNYSDLLPAKKKREGKREIVAAPMDRRTEKRKRVGRGRSAGQGKTCGAGQKGQKSRTGYSRRAGFEGGQMPLHRRLPKRGFTNIFKQTAQLVNLGQMEKAGLKGEVGPEQLRKAGLIGDSRKPIKVLGNGDFSGKLTITADSASLSAIKKIEAAGGTFAQRKPVGAKAEKG